MGVTRRAQRQLLAKVAVFEPTIYLQEVGKDVIRHDVKGYKAIAITVNCYIACQLTNCLIDPT